MPRRTITIFGPGQFIATPAPTPTPTPTPTPSVSYDIILVASDSYGRGVNARAGGDVLGATVFQYNSNSSDPHYRTITQDLPLSQPIAPDGTNYLSIAEPMANAHAIRTGNPTLIVPFAWNGTNLLSSGHRWQVGDDLHEGAIAQANLAITAAKAVYPGSKIAVILLLDSGLANDAINYSQAGTAVDKAAAKTMLATVVADFRSRITGASSAPILFHAFPPEFIASYNGNGKAQPRDFCDAIREYAAAASGVYYVDVAPGTSDDNLHLNNAGIRLVGPKLDAILADTVAPVIAALSTFSVYTGQPINIPLAADKYVTWTTATSGWEIFRTFGTGGAGGINTALPAYTLRLTGNANASYASPPANPTVVARDGAGNTSSKTITVNVLPAYGSTAGTGTVTEAHSFASQFNGSNAPFPYTVPSVVFGAGLNLIWILMNGSTTSLTGVTVNGVAATLVSSQGSGDISKCFSIPLAMAGNFDVVLTGTGSVAAVSVDVVTLTNSLATPTGSPYVLDNGYHNSPFGSGSITCPSGGKIVCQGYIGSGAATPDAGVTATYNDTAATGIVDGYRTSTGALTFSGNNGYASLHVSTWGPA